MTDRTCQACPDGHELGMMDILQGDGICLAAVKARARAATTDHRCHCGRKRNARPGARDCARCLGAVR